MKITRGYRDRLQRPYPVATIGNFDGHHIGHRALLQAVLRSARQAGGTALVLTFDPHPVKILAPEVKLRFLTDPEEKLARFEAAGIDEVVLLEFNESFARLSPEAFVKDVLVEGLGLKEIIVGRHFAFGHKRAGKIADLMALGEKQGLLVHSLSPVEQEGIIVSSTRIRQLVQAGNVGEAANLLGRQYAIAGVVRPGSQRGQRLGWPTANLALPADRVIPRDGVFATITVVNQQRLDSVAYIGKRPTFDGGERLLEVYVLKGTHDLYGRSITVEFIERVRDDIQFAGHEELSRQIASDVTSAATMLRRHHESIGAS